MTVGKVLEVFRYLEFMCLGGLFVAISYKPLWHQLLERDMKKLEFRDYVEISNGTLAKLGKNEPVSMDVIEKICLALDCRIEEIVEITK
jgi:DNA-binding Xre family transcriptional regulator